MLSAHQTTGLGSAQQAFLCRTAVGRNER